MLVFGGLRELKISPCQLKLTSSRCKQSVHSDHCFGCWEKNKKRGRSSIRAESSAVLNTRPSTQLSRAVRCRPAPIPAGGTLSTKCTSSGVYRKVRLNTGLEGVGRRRLSCDLGRPLLGADICTDCGTKEWVSHANSLAKRSPGRKTLEATAFSVGFRNSKAAGLD